MSQSSVSSQSVNTGLEDPHLSRVAWLQVYTGAVLMLATLPGRTQGLGLITEPLLRELRLDRVSYASMNLWATLLGALFCFPTGWALDRFGVRRVAPLVVAALGLVVAQLSSTSGAAVVMFGLLLGTRALGQSALSVCSITAVARWFPQRAGYPMGVYSVLLSVFFAAAFGLIGYSVRVNGWRSAWWEVSLTLLFVVAPFSLIALREAKAIRDPGVEAPQVSAAELTLAEALRTPAFWLFAGAAAAFNLVSSGLGLFNEAVLAERGFDQKSFHMFLALSTLFSLGGQFFCGWLTRRWSYQALSALALALYALSLAAIPLLTQAWHLWALSVLLGFSGGIIIVIFFSVWADLFGQRHLGRIQGAAQMVTVLSSGLGPVLFARTFEQTRSYAPLLFVLSATTLLLAALARRTRLPRPTAPSQCVMT